MFRLNLYPEGEARRRERLARAASTGVVTGLVAVVLGVTALHGVSAALLSERAKALARRRVELEKEVAAMRPEETARTLAALRGRIAERAERVVWSTKLAELARLIPAPLVIDDIRVTERARGQAVPSLTIHGSVLPGRVRDPVPTLGTFVAALKENAEFSAGIASVDLASVSTDDGTGLTSFTIVCAMREPPPEAGAGAPKPQESLAEPPPGRRP